MIQRWPRVRRNDREALSDARLEQLFELYATESDLHFLDDDSVYDLAWVKGRGRRLIAHAIRVKLDWKRRRGLRRDLEYFRQYIDSMPGRKKAKAWLRQAIEYRLRDLAYSMGTGADSAQAGGRVRSRLGEEHYESDPLDDYVVAMGRELGALHAEMENLAAAWQEEEELWSRPGLHRQYGTPNTALRKAGSEAHAGGLIVGSNQRGRVHLRSAVANLEEVRLLSQFTGFNAAFRHFYERRRGDFRAERIFQVLQAILEALSLGVVGAASVAGEAATAAAGASRLSLARAAGARIVARMRGLTPATRRLVRAAEAEGILPKPPPLFYRPTVTGSTSMSAGEGATTAFGDVTYSTLGSQTEQNLARFHEQVHSFLSPRLRFLRTFRADLGMDLYNRSRILRYIEEALAETVAQLRVNGIRGLPDGIAFPIRNGYMQIAKYPATMPLGAEIAIGTVAVGGYTYTVYVIATRDVDEDNERASQRDLAAPTRAGAR